MSNLITTAQDSFRQQCIEAFVGLQAWAESMAERAREERGQTAAEYMGILFIISAIIVAIVGAHLEKTIADRLGKIVTAIGNGVTP
jgi:Flp pilus assembly pilin Flp